MNRILGAALLVPALSLSISCQDRVRSAESAQQAITAANAYLSRQGFHTAIRMVVRKVDFGDRWRLAYGEPGSVASIIIVVNKRSGKVVYMEAQQ